MVDVVDRVFVPVVDVEGTKLQCQGCRRKSNRSVTWRHEVTCAPLKHEFGNILEHDCNEDAEIERCFIFIQLAKMGVMTVPNDDESILETKKMSTLIVTAITMQSDHLCLVRRRG